MTSTAEVSMEIRHMFADRGISTVEAIGALESVKFSLLIDAWEDTKNMEGE